MRFLILVVASEDGASVYMVFFGDVAQDLVGKPADVLLVENYSLVSTIPSEISGLAGRKFVVDVTVSRCSFQAEDISFQVLRFE